jgi:hypothetical protein
MQNPLNTFIVKMFKAEIKEAFPNCGFIFKTKGANGVDTVTVTYYGETDLRGMFDLAEGYESNTLEFFFKGKVAQLV